MRRQETVMTARPGPGRLRVRLAGLEAHPVRLPEGAAREFHVSRASRVRYQFNHALFAITGNVILADYQAVRVFAQKLNEKRGAPAAPETAVHAGALNAMGLIDEILHYVVSLYAAQARPSVFLELAAELEQKAGAAAVRRTLLRFCTDFPPLSVHLEKVAAEEYLLGTTSGVANRETLLEEMLLLWLANVNPAFAPFRELFADEGLAKDTAYSQLLDSAREFFARMPVFGPDGQNLVDMLRSPALAFPDSLSGQLRYIREKWGLLLGRFSDRLLSGLDLIREDEKKFPPGPGPAAVFEAGGPSPGEEGERFSQDREWMPRLVLMAKSVHVWLDQLSRKYGRAIATLDRIPDEELERLAAWGFSGLWLIGVWERSRASRRIKQKCGNPEALASAYSLYRYEVAADLGGEAALENLRGRAWARGIRLASDMVPNHMGIDSPWVVEHPEWFVSLDQSPFPSYTFNGEDLSGDPRVGIYLEDHYYDHSDAAVVFKWVDRRTGKERYIYHGNDGTRMPWNDTAQLNYLRPDVREAVLQTILDVSRKFPIIRFDAAMTLTRRHYQRLWFPAPGSGGDIPSRAGQGMPGEHFNRVMPWEFWREVVDRVARENPDTLLLAEAFWLMESYFVRSLGMHRVYNSAFMNFLKMEENAKFRLSLKNVLEFNPEILKRYVNFMNNPDEETALAQFGGGDKYFGACTLMAALPGLPMFGHGQVEGFREKYGMEYRRAYVDEREDGELVRRHERQIFPLLRRRELFAGVDDFLLYDFFLSGGTVDENVIAFSNCREGERGLVVFHNRFADTAGWIRMSAAYAAEDPFGGPRTARRQDLGSGLELRDEPGWFVIFRDLVSGLGYIRSCGELHRSGMFLELRAYQTHVFLDFHEVADDAGGQLARLAAYLGGRGFTTLEGAAREMAMQPLLAALRELGRPEFLERLAASLHGPAASGREHALWQELEEKAGVLMLQAAALAGNADGGKGALKACLEDLLSLRALFLPMGRPAAGAPGAAQRAKEYLQPYWLAHAKIERFCIFSIFLRRAAGHSFGDWQLDGAVEDALRSWGWPQGEVAPYGQLLKAYCGSAERIRSCAAGLTGTKRQEAADAAELVLSLLAEEPLRAFLQVNRSAGEWFFGKEAFAAFCEWLTVMLQWEIYRAASLARKERRLLGKEALDRIESLPEAAAKAGYRLEMLREKLAEIRAK
jgi:glycosidase/truncated hemoglobin YjbI